MAQRRGFGDLPRAFLHNVSPKDGLHVYNHISSTRICEGPFHFDPYLGMGQN